MYIRRKVFSKLQTENGEERYFSTTEFTLMSKEDQRMFSKKKDKDEDDEGEYLKEDRKAIKKYKRNPELAELKEAALNGDSEAKEKLGKKASRRALIGSGLAGAGMGALYGGTLGESGKAALIGAAGGAAAGLGLGAAAGKAAKRNWKNSDKKSRNAQFEVDKELDKDRLAVANGNMTKKEFIKKWGGK